jgi:hypothetical protein
VLARQGLKGQCHEHESFSPQAPEYPIMAVSKFFEKSCILLIGSSRCTAGVVDTSGKWKKSSSRKVLIILSLIPVVDLDL